MFQSYLKIHHQTTKNLFKSTLSTTYNINSPVHTSRIFITTIILYYVIEYLILNVNLLLLLIMYVSYMPWTQF